MLKKDWAEGKVFCSGCGKPASVICRCEVSNFRQPDDDEEEDD